MSKNRTYKMFDINDLLLRGHILHNSKTGKKKYILEKAHTHKNLSTTKEDSESGMLAIWKKKMWDVSYD